MLPTKPFSLDCGSRFVTESRVGRDKGYSLPGEERRHASSIMNSTVMKKDLT